MSDVHYSDEFYSSRGETTTSARNFIGVLGQFIKPSSVIDVGCGLGEFLSVFQQQGITDIFGVDGPWVNKANLKIPADKFNSIDLEKPFNLGRKFDLVISVEVAEHIHATSADTFIETLTNLGEVVVFSAAIPLQGGTFHVNEQWPQYWANKFKSKGYVAIDCLRSRIWNHPHIKPWYKQNAAIYVQENALQKYPLLQKEYKGVSEVLPLVHPEIYTSYASKYKKVTEMIPRPMRHLLRKIVHV